MLVLAFVPVVLVLALIVGRRWWGHPSQAVTFRINPENATGVVGEYVTPVDRGEITLNFSEGSRITLGPHARARVAQTTPQGASFVLETGGAHLDVVHRVDTDWTVRAGPYTIAVKGTSFDVSWNTSSSTLEVVMFNGIVIVRGPGMESGVEVKDTQQFVSRVVANSESATNPPNTEPSGAPVEFAPPTSESTITSRATPTASERDDHLLPTLTSPLPPSAPVASETPTHIESWSVLASRGEYQSVVRDAEQRGIDTTLGSAPESELAALANAARYAGRADVAQRTLMTIRTRFPGGPQAASAAFVLGRMSEDSGSLDSAIRWYDTYLSEAGRGALAPEAMGRKMVALRKAGQSDAARKAAEAYLSQFPAGPYAGVAREIGGH